MTTQEPQPSPSRCSSPEPVKPWEPVLEALNKEQLVLQAASLHQRLHGKASTPSIGEHMMGSFNVCFPLTFKSGLRWLIKFPFAGTKAKWDKPAISAMISEAQTMRLIKRETTIPLPEVLDFSPTISNPIGCPYIVMTYIPGIPLHTWWYEKQDGLDLETIRARRTRTLEGIAQAMVQLSKFTFSTGGSLVFNKDGSLDPTRTGPLRYWDFMEGLKNYEPGPWYKERAVSSDTKDYYTLMIDVHAPKGPYNVAVYALLRQFIAWIPEPTSGGKPFVLSHPDFNMQNMIVDENGVLQGIIDWDGVGALPRTLGNEKLPLWLTEDWNQDEYLFIANSDDEDNDEDENDAPEDYAYNRAVYIDLIEKAKRRMRRGNSPVERVWTYIKGKKVFSKKKNNICRMSLFTQNLAAAVWDPIRRQEVMSKLVRNCWVVQGGPEDYRCAGDMGSVCAAQEEDPCDTIDTMRDGFLMLLAKEGL
ncbi:phosphotransferase family protein [Aspergillus mulundensis]|uniref:Aminoglycoside phosphotransferase domain-containing protein n=1 Tax=Aspergillus mulundensis TaxID=1810919 RepID=A0A3D8QVP4_9EURO|nr:hypothetical protein DSM5745_09584 [Aspergillus mulundensis]RDW65845.1 hypothetical protein DSM5745_09584 [Aspergillus mulundensis]